MRIIIPQQVKSNFKGYMFFIELQNKLQNCDDEEILISFKQTKVFEANLSAILRAVNNYCRDRNKIIKLIEISEEIKSVFIFNNFIQGTKEELSSIHVGSIIPFMKFTPYKDIEFMEYVKNEMLSKPKFPKHSLMLGKKINTSIFELFENARTHSNCKFIYTCGQITYDEGVTRIDFTIVDMGKTIKKNVNEYLNQNLSGADAIEWALDSGHTTKTGNISGGLGLDIIFEFIKLNQGRIQIVSSDGFWEYNNNKSIKKTFNNPFNGTIANIEINLNDKKRYKLKEEISLKDIF